MNALFESFRLALRSIARSGLRSALTVLGVLIGVAAVVVVVALGQSARDEIGSQIESLGTNLIYVFNGDGEGRVARGARVGHRLAVTDAEAIRHQVAGLRGITVYASNQAQVVSEFDTARVDI